MAIAAKLIVLAVVLSLGACTPASTPDLIDFSVPSRKNAFGFPDQIYRSAMKSADRYKARANNLANDGILFGAPAMAGTIGTGFTAIFRGSLREIQAFGLSAVSFIGGGQYFAPRDRAKVYFSAGRQMGCIATLARQTSFHIYGRTDSRGRGPTHLSRTFLYAVGLLHGVTDPAQKAALLQVTSLPDTSVQQLAAALDSIDSNALSDGLAKSNASPAYGNLASTLVSNAQSSFTTGSAATAGLTSLGVDKQRALTRQLNDAGIKAPQDQPADEDQEEPAAGEDLSSPRPGLHRTIATEADKQADAATDVTNVQHLIAFAANFNVALTSCIIAPPSGPAS